MNQWDFSDNLIISIYNVYKILIIYITFENIIDSKVIIQKNKEKILCKHYLERFNFDLNPCKIINNIAMDWLIILLK